MSFTTVNFIGFLLVVTVGYYLIPGRFQWVFLLLASYGFYMAGGWNLVGYLLFTTITTYTAGLLLGRLNEQKKNLTGPDRKKQGNRIKNRKRLVVAAVCVLNFGLLYLLKYWNFTASALGKLFAGKAAFPQLDLLLPLGISFYMFQSIGYVVDCSRGKYPPEKNVLKFALFVSFFPQVIQGPIARFDQLGKQLTEQHSFSADNLKYGIQLVMWGYFKKMLIADRAVVVVNTVFSAYEGYTGAVIGFGVLLYCIQLYCDFSGGIDITRGVARMLGIELAENFRRPLFATSLADYWRRWHISLGQWMKDYVFYSLTLSKPFVKLGKFTRKKVGGTLGKVIPTSLATFIVYFVIGIWHGANFRYVFYGLCNGTIITSSLLLKNFYHRLRCKLRIDENSRGLKVFCMVRTWILVFFGRYITRAPRLLTAFGMIWATVSNPGVSSLWDGTLLTLGLPLTDLLIVGVCTALMLAVEFAQERGVQIRKWLEERSGLIQWLVILAAWLILLLNAMQGSFISTEFIYKQF